MSAPFPLGSSVSYWLWGNAGQFGLHRIGGPEVGAIAVMGRNGNPADGFGPNGHTGIVVASAPGTVTCIESRGGVGVCFKTRARGEWDGFCRIDGMSAAVLNGMRVWESLYDALTGTVERVPYYSGAGDNDHDGIPDRADIGDGNGIDCSGAVKLCADYGFDHAAGNPAPQPPPSPAPGPPPDPTVLLRAVQPTDEETEEAMIPAKRVPYEGAMHTFYVSKAAQLWQKLDTADGATHEFCLTNVLKLGPVVQEPPTVAISPDGDLLVGVRGTDGTFNDLRWDTKSNAWQQQVGH